MVIKIRSRVKVDTKKLEKKVDEANFKSLYQAGNFIRTVARRSIEPRPKGTRRGRKKAKRQISERQKQAFLKKLKDQYDRKTSDQDFIERIEEKRKKTNRKASTPPKPPYTGPQKQLRKSIMFKVEKDPDNVIVGSTYGDVADIGKAHEHGGRFRGKRYPKRPFMRPALLVAAPRLPKRWANALR